MQLYECRQDENGRWYPYIDGKKLGGMAYNGITYHVPSEGFGTQEEVVDFMAPTLTKAFNANFRVDGEE